MACYTDFKRGNLKLRPEMGVGMGVVRIAGGYNIPTFENKALPGLARSNGQLTIQLALPVSRRTVANGSNIFRELFNCNHGTR